MRISSRLHSRSTRLTVMANDGSRSCTSIGTAHSRRNSGEKEEGRRRRLSARSTLVPAAARYTSLSVGSSRRKGGESENNDEIRDASERKEHRLSLSQ